MFIHRRGIGQFESLARHLAGTGVDVTLVTESVAERLSGIRIVRHRSEPAPREYALAQHLATTDHHVRVGLRVAETLDALRRSEGEPDLVIGHIGWGSLMFVKDALPATPALGYCEFFYRAEGADVGFDPEHDITLDMRQRLRLRNAAQLVTLEAIEAGFSPTHWQKSRYPGALRNRIAVCHEGIDTERFRPDRRAMLKLPDGRVLKAGDPVVTFAARSLEPYRGFPQAMKAAAIVLRRHPDATFVFVGGDDVSYGTARADGLSWREALVAETGIDPARVVFPGWVSHAALTRLFQVSAAHVYLTYPFVLSWSMLEAMACGALLIGSATAPVEEVIRHGTNGLAVPFFDHEALADTILDALARPQAMLGLRAAARRTVERRFSLPDCLARQSALAAEAIGLARRKIAG